MSRKRLHAVAWAALFTSLLLIIPTGYAHAYLDPGSGSLIVQIVIGGLLAFLIAVRMYWTRIVNFLTGRKPAEDPGTGDQANIPGEDGS